MRRRRPPIELLALVMVGVTPAACVQMSVGDPSAGPESTDPGAGDATNGGTNAGDGGPAAANAAGLGNVILHRLNKVQYVNTTRDLLGASVDLINDLPEDDLVNDFDNAIDVPIGSVNIQAYLTAAQKLVTAALDPANPNRAQLVICEPTAPADFAGCGQRILQAFLLKAFRRPPTAAEIGAHLAYFAGAASFADGLSAALQAALVSPHFVFRVELGDAAHKLTDYELAARLSYFLWSTTPDEGLLAKAAAHQLTAGPDLAAEVRRMLADPKGLAFVQNFAGQWLGVRSLPKVTPSPALFPDFDEALRLAIAAEAYAYFQDVLSSNASALTLLKSNFTFVNQRLAQHYGIAGVTGNDLTRVQTDDTRGGVLTQASMLAITSTPDRTSIVKRGKWVLTKLLCQHLPPPPPGVTALDGNAPDGQTRRQQVEQHRANPACASCHKIIDPIGFGLENYDAVGAYRTTDNGQPVDSAGQLPDGRGFKNAGELAALLQNDARFPSCMEDKLLTYALGRLPDAGAETEAAAALLARAAANQYKFADMVVDLATSDLFRSVHMGSTR